MSLEERPKFDVATALAKSTIQRSILLKLVSDGDRLVEMWEDYPEIGEHDWNDICRGLLKGAEERSPKANEFMAAYTHLAGRADHS